MNSLGTLTFLLLASATVGTAVKKISDPGPARSGAAGTGNGGTQKSGYVVLPYRVAHHGGVNGDRNVVAGSAVHVPLVHVGSDFSKVFVRPAFMIKTKQGETFMVKTVHHVQRVNHGEPMMAFTDLVGHNQAGGYGYPFGQGR